MALTSADEARGCPRCLRMPQGHKQGAAETLLTVSLNTLRSMLRSILLGVLLGLLLRSFLNVMLQLFLCVSL